jgi:hypothetical protein
VPKVFVCLVGGRISASCDWPGGSGCSGGGPSSESSTPIGFVSSTIFGIAEILSTPIEPIMKSLRVDMIKTLIQVAI